MRGKYALPSTLWLARQLRAGAEPSTLRKRWQIRRRMATGKPVADVRSSFNKAVAKARELNERRQHGHR